MPNRTVLDLFNAVFACKSDVDMADVLLAETHFQRTASNPTPIDPRAIAVANICHVIGYEHDSDQRVRVTRLLNRVRNQ